MPLHMHDGAAWRQARAMHFHDGAAWRPAREVYIHDGSGWRLAFLALRATIANRSVSAVHTGFGSQGLATAAFRLLADGSAAFYTIEGSTRNDSTIPGEWLTQGSASQFEVMATPLAGTTYTPTGDALNQWLPLSANREWRVFAASNNAQGVSLRGELRIDIRAAAGGSIVASAIVNLYAFASREQF